jgi:thioredoxin-related protein
MVVLAKRTENFCAGGSVEVQYTSHDSRGEDGEKKIRDALVGFEQKNRRECVNRETEELWQLANHYCERDAVHVAVADRLSGIPSLIYSLLLKSMLREFCIFCLGAVISIQPVLSCDLSDDTNFPRSAALAKRTNRPLLLAFIGTDWSISSLKLDREVFDQAEFVDDSKYNFVLCKLHFYQTQERFPEIIRQNEELATKYKVQEFPTVVVLNPDGRDIGRLGYVPGGVKAFAAAANAIIAKSRQQEQH